jgi:hypothetical protein
MVLNVLLSVCVTKLVKWSSSVMKEEKINVMICGPV